MFRKIVKFLLIVLLVFLAIAFAAPILFKDKIIAKIKSSINNNISAKVDFNDVDISLFRHFPRVAVAVNNVHVAGIDDFKHDTLISAKKIDIALNLISVIKGTDMKVYSVIIDSARINAIVNKEGKANWDIAKENDASSDTSEARPFKLELKHYSVNNGYIRFLDQKNNVISEIVNLNHEGSGDFTSDLFMLQTTTTADAVNFTLNKIPYVMNAKTSIKADIQVNNKTNTYQYETGNILVNDLKLSSKGFVQLMNDSVYNMDITFYAPSNDFKSVLSLIPTIYKNDFQKVNASGKAVFNGFVKGIYGPDRLPAYTLNLHINNGFFQYTDLPRPVRNVNVSVQVDNPDGITDHTTINIPQGHLEMDNEPFDFRLLIKQPVSDMYIDGAVKGKLDLSGIVQFVKLQAGTKLSGMLKADVSAKGTIGALQQQQFDQLNAAGSIAVSSLQYASADYPDGVKVNNLFMTFNTNDITISDLDAQYKRTNFSSNGTIRNLIPFILRDKTISGDLFFKADHMNLNEWMGTTADTASKSNAPGAPFAVPANVNMNIRAVVGRLLYDKLEMQELSGDIMMKDEGVTLNNIKGNALEGSMLINGSYSTKANRNKPDISINYDVSGLDVQKTFYTFNTVQKLMPVGQYLSGNLSSQLKLTGQLGESMMPDLGSLTGNGNLLLIEGFLQKFAPLEKLAQLLNVNELKEITMRDIKNYVEFNRGMVMVKPFTVKVNDIEMQMGGMHGFNQTLDYLINLKMPRSLMGDKGNAFVNNLMNQVNSKGIPVKIGETVNLHIKMTGTIKSPVFKIDLKETAQTLADEFKQKAFDFAKNKIDSAKITVRDSALSVRKLLEKNVQDELRRKIYGKKDSINNNQGAPDTIKRKIEQAGKGLIRDLFKRKKGDTTN